MYRGLMVREFFEEKEEEEVKAIAQSKSNGILVTNVHLDNKSTAIMDSGASSIYIMNKEIFDKIKMQVTSANIVVGNNEKVESLGIGSIGIFSMAHYCPSLAYNLFATDAFDKLRYETKIGGGKMSITLEEDGIVHDQLVMSRSPDGLYRCRITDIKKL